MKEEESTEDDMGALLHFCLEHVCCLCSSDFCQDCMEKLHKQPVAKEENRSSKAVGNRRPKEPGTGGSISEEVAHCRGLARCSSRHGSSSCSSHPWPCLHHTSRHCEQCFGERHLTAMPCGTKIYFKWDPCSNQCGTCGI